MELRYDIIATGENQLRSVIRGIESEIIASNRRMTTAIRGSHNGVSKPRALGAGSATALARTADRETKKSADLAIREERRIFAEKERNVKRFAQIELQAIEKVKNEQEKADKARQKTIASFAKGAGKTVGHSVMGMARAGAGAATLAGGILIGSALHDQMQVQAYASRVANQGERPDLKGQLATGSQKLAGFTGEESLSALDQFVQKSGDLKAGIAAWQMMGKVSLATSSDITEVGEAAGAAYNSIAQDTKDPIERLKILNDVMKTLSIQGNMGSVEMRDFAVELPKLAAAARRFGGDSGSNLKMMGALTQLAVKKGGATDAAEASTAVMRFTDDLIRDARGKKGKPGLDVFTDKTNTKMRDPGEIIGDIMAKTGGDLTKVGALFGMRGMKAMSGVSPAYLDAFNAAEKNKKGTGEAAGRAAINDALKQFSGASMSEGELDKRAKLRLDDPDLQVKEAVKQFNVAIGTQLMPVLTALIPQFTALVPTAAQLTGALASVVQFVSQDPFAGIGAIVAGKVALDLANAGITEAAKKALGTSLGQAGGIMIGSAMLGIGIANFIMGGKEMAANSRLNALDANDQMVRDQAKAEMDSGGLSDATRARLEAVKDREERRVQGTQFTDPLNGVGIGRQLLNTFTFGATGPTAFNDSSVTGSVDTSRIKQNIENKAQTDALLQQANAASKIGAAADKLSGAADKLAMADPNRSKPLVARPP